MSSITGDVKTTEEKENLHKFVEKWINDYKANESDYTKMVDTMRSEETALWLLIGNIKRLENLFIAKMVYYVMKYKIIHIQEELTAHYNKIYES